MNMAEMLLSMGGREWAKGGLHRIYLPVEVSARVLELKVTRYDSGNISSATLEGEKISNASAKEILYDLEGAYYDVVADKFKSSHGLAGKLRERLASTRDNPHAWSRVFSS